MVLKSKIVIFLISMFSVVLFMSCKKDKNDVIPDVYIDFNISLNDPQFFDLTAPLNSAYVSAQTNNIGIYAAGFDGNGIIIYRASEDEFYAYDRTCPHDYAVNNKSIKVNIVDGIYAVCPVCNTKYALPNYGTPLPGAGRYPLKNYKTNFTGQLVHVWNYF
jgi:nitrite reductase/ring-hydroxylating ferredoxin subunit